MKPRVTHLAITVALACHAVPQIAKAAPSPERLAWFEDYTREAIAAPVTLDNAVKYAWYRIPAAEWIKRQGVTRFDVGYLQEQLAQHGQTALAALKVQLDAKLGALQSLDEAGSYGDPKHCAWIMSLRSPDYQPTKLQEDLRQYCAEHALPSLYKRLLAKRVAAFDVRLATLPHLNVSYPGDLLQGAFGTVGSDIAAAYGQDLDGRLKSAEPGVRADVVRTFQVKAVGDGPLETADAQCKALLGPWYQGPNAAWGDTLYSRGPGQDAALQFGRAAQVACQREASEWLRGKGPEVTAAVRAGLAALDPARERILSVQARCNAVLGRWFSRPDDFDRKLTDPVSQACHDGTEAFNLKAVDVRARALTARFETAPRTLDGLERNGWFEPAAAEIQAVTDLRDFHRNEVEKALRDTAESLVQPAREAALQAARAEIAHLYEAGGMSEADLVPARRLCGPYFNDQTRALPVGGNSVRPQLVKACQDGEKAALNRRLEAALAASHLKDVLGTEQLAIASPGGGLVPVNPREFVVQSALKGLQVIFVSDGFFWFWQSPTAVRVVPMGGDSPALVAALKRVDQADRTRLWRMDDMPTLMGLGSPSDTLACLLVDEAQTGAWISTDLSAGIVAEFVGLHRTGDVVISNAAGARRDLNVCKGARTSYFGASPSSAKQGSNTTQEAKAIAE